MPLYGERKNILSLELVEYIKTAVEDFCENKSLYREEIPELFDYKVISRIVKDLGLKVKVEELTEEPITAPRETPLEIINRVTEVADNKVADSPPSGIESALRGHPMVVL